MVMVMVMVNGLGWGGAGARCQVRGSTMVPLVAEDRVVALVAELVEEERVWSRRKCVGER